MAWRREEDAASVRIKVGDRGTLGKTRRGGLKRVRRSQVEDQDGARKKGEDRGCRTRNMKWKKRKSGKENIRKEKMKSMVSSL